MSPISRSKIGSRKRSLDGVSYNENKGDSSPGSDDSFNYFSVKSTKSSKTYTSKKRKVKNSSLTYYQLSLCFKNIFEQKGKILDITRIKAQLLLTQMYQFIEEDELEKIGVPNLDGKICKKLYEKLQNNTIELLSELNLLKEKKASLKNKKEHDKIKNELENLKELINDLHPIYFSVPSNFTEMLSAALKDKVDKSFEEVSKKETLDKFKPSTNTITAIEKSKQTPYIFGKRPSPFSYTKDGDKIDIIKTDIHTRQYCVEIETDEDCVTNYIYDIFSEGYIEAPITEVDHSDPWDSFKNRVEYFLKCINEFPEDIKQDFLKIINNFFPNYFVNIEIENKIYASEYLIDSLFNDLNNLLSLKSSENNTKRAKDFREWFVTTKLNKWFKHTVCHESEVSDIELFDDTGFLIKLKNEEYINMEFRGKGLAEALRICFLDEQKNYYKIKEKIKTQIVLSDRLSSEFKHEIRRFEILSDLESESKIEIIKLARKVYDDFEIEKSKGIYKKHSRNTFRTIFEEIFTHTGHDFETSFIYKIESGDTSLDMDSKEFEEAKLKIKELENLLEMSNEDHMKIQKIQNEISMKIALIAKKDAQIIDNEALIVERDTLIIDKDALIADKDAQIIKKDAIIIEKDALIIVKEEEIKKRDKVINNLWLKLKEHGIETDI